MHHRWLIIGSLAGVGTAVLLMMQPGCSPGQCKQSLLDPNTPSPALECAAGLLCYQGQCIKACSAGQERAQVCTGDGDCDGTRPRCIDGFCSACEQEEFCVPTLNICQAINEVPLPDPPGMPPPGPQPPAPLDGGWIDGGLRLDKDAGVEVPIDAVVTHAGLIDIAQLADYSGGGAPIVKSKLTVKILNVAAVPDPGLVWRVDAWDDVAPPVRPSTEQRLEEVLGEECVLNALTTYTASVSLPPTDFGTIRIDSGADFPNSIAMPIVVPFTTGDYVVPTNLPANLLRYSILSPSEPHFLSVTGGGSPLTSGAFPNPEPENGEHVIFELVPTDDTKILLQDGVHVPITSPGDLVVRWEAIRTGVVAGEAVVLRFRSPNYEINCQEVEGSSDGAITVKAGLLRSFITREGIPAGTSYPLYFERAFAERLNVEPASTEVVDISVRIRHTLIGTVSFE